MTSPDPEFDSLVDALRSDLPTKSDERRVRRRLLAAGIGVATGTVASGASASGLAGGSSSAAALLQKFGALSWTVKMGLAGVAATAALPTALYLTNATSSPPRVDVAPPVLGAPLQSPPRGARAPAHPMSERGAPPVATALDTMDPKPALAPRVPAPVSHDPSAVEEPYSSPRASSAAFPMDEGDGERTSTLGEENALIERALYALKQGDRDGARRALDEHARRFPNGLLARERDRALSRANATDDPKNPTNRPMTGSVPTP